MKGDVVGIRKKRVELAWLGGRLLHDLRRDEWIIRQDLHLEPDTASCHQATDRSEADNANGLSGKLHPGIARRLPLVLPDGAVGLRQVAAQGEQMCKGELGGRRRVGIGCIEHHDATLRCCGDVDIIHANAGPADCLEPRGCGDDRSRDPRFGANDESVVVRNARGQVCLVESRFHIHFDSGITREQRPAVGMDRVRNQDLVEGIHSISICLKTKEADCGSHL